MPRTRSIFQLCYALGSSAVYGSPSAIKLDFQSATDDAIFPPDVLRARLLREQASLQAWVKNTRNLRTLPELHSWLFSTHSCYAVAMQVTSGAQASTTKTWTDRPWPRTSYVAAMYT
eukprot:jgi/Botrbrau1/16491/Bobra.0142s0085.1